ncbi:putative tail fiber [Salmonella phage 19]|nr:putative tail fiber [Salmonella phage 19]
MQATVLAMKYCGKYAWKHVLAKWDMILVDNPQITQHELYWLQEYYGLLDWIRCDIHDSLNGLHLILSNAGNA